MIEFTGLDGQSVYVRKEAVAYVQKSFGPGTWIRFLASDGNGDLVAVIVQESPAIVNDMLEGK